MEQIKEEEEELVIYTEDKRKLGIMKKNNYKRLTGKLVDGNGKEIEPWVECVTCFVIDKKSKEVAVELRGLSEIDPGELDLCSGHVRAGEIPKIAMIRELKEEMGLENMSNESIANELILCGKVKMDFTKAKKNSSKNLRCFATAYAIQIDDRNIVKPNDPAVLKIAWSDFERMKDDIRNSRYRFPFTAETAKDYENIFDNVDRVLQGRKNEINCLEVLSER